MIKIGQSMHPNWVNGDLSKLDEELRQFKEAGAESCELVLHGLDVIVGARIIDLREKALLNVLRKHDLSFTLHMPHGLNLLDIDNIDIYVEIFRAAIDFAQAAGIGLINYHAGKKKVEMKINPDAYAIAEERAKQDPNTLIFNEIDQIRSLAKDAPDILICMENAQFGNDPEISAANNADGMLEFFRQVNLANFKLTFDIGHSFLSHNGDKSALLKDMERLLPYTGHIHLHDNCGFRKDIKVFDGGHRLVLGTGDIHLPLGWGSVPVKEALGLLSNYNGIVNLETERRFFQYYSDSIAFVRENLT